MYLWHLMIRKTFICFPVNLFTKDVTHPTDFPLTLARWPMASEHWWRTSDFLSYWPGLPSGIPTIVKNFKKRKTKLFSWKNLQFSKNLKKIVMWPSVEPITDLNSLWNLIFDEFLFCPFPFKEHTSKDRVPTFPDWQNSLTFPVFFCHFSSIFLMVYFFNWKLDPL